MIFILILLLLIPNISFANTRHGLVGWWKMDESSGDALDSSVSGNAGTPTGTTITANCKRSECRSFNGTSDYIDFADEYDFAAPGTVSVWVSTGLDSAQALFGVSESSTASNFWVAYLGNNVTGTLTNEIITIARTSGGVGTYILGYTTATRTELIGGWHHVVITASGSTIAIYIDGVSKTVTVGSGSNNGTFTNVSSVNSTKIGSRIVSGTNASFFNGFIDDARIYNRVLTAQEIKDLYNNGVRLGYLPGT